MSWMDSCQRRTNAAASAKTEARYCSTRCRHQKPGKLDREIERAFAQLLEGRTSLEAGRQPAANGHAAKHGKKGGVYHKAGRKVKGDQRILVSCSAVEDLVFGRGSEDSHSDRSGSPEHERENGHEREEREHVIVMPTQPPEEQDGAPHVADIAISSDEGYVDGDVLARLSVRSGTRIRPPQSVSEVNGSVGGEKGWAERIEESEEMLGKRRQGLRRAKEKEMVRCAARRGSSLGSRRARRRTGTGPRGSRARGA
ncbi:unnamed protein product [Parascedosporium putredinis]|uniref:Uncharacterized protein n=1 Tax=Parascedosporium putredinis TaxID=1442378 RepID=A0A9P1M6A2_9PEZI|nr:unnamed protein product [Parascedosporium putredinis]CAI7989338.1 unnamed protein product [Parascedosporium putredinis]